MKKILINGGGYADIPLIKAAKELGFYVITTGNNENEIGHKFSHFYIKADYSNKTEIFNIVKKNNIDYIVPNCNDFSILTASYVMEQTGQNYFDSFKITKLIHHKDLFRKFAIENELPTPKALSFNSFKEIESYKLSNFPLPCIIKPVDLTGGKGVNIAKTYDEILKYANIAFNISKEKKVIIEEFIDGEHYSCFLFIHNKKIKLNFFAKEYYFKNNFLVAGAVSEYGLSCNVKNIIYQNIENMINLLNLKDGIMHIQFILKNNIPYFIEITRRSPGDLYLKLIDYSLGIDVSKLIIKANCNILNDDDFNIEYKQNRILRHCVMSEENGIFEKINLDNSLKNNLIEIFPIMKSGDSIENYLIQKMAILFFKFDNYSINNIHKFVYPSIFSGDRVDGL